MAAQKLKTEMKIAFGREKTNSTGFKLFVRFVKLIVNLSGEDIENKSYFIRGYFNFLYSKSD